MKLHGFQARKFFTVVHLFTHYYVKYPKKIIITTKCGSGLNCTKYLVILRNILKNMENMSHSEWKHLDF